MPDNVKTALSNSIRRLLRPLVKIMLREGLTYSDFNAIAQMAFVESAAKDFSERGSRVPVALVANRTRMSQPEIQKAISEQERFEAYDLVENSLPIARVLHAWHNDRDYVGPYGLPLDLSFDEGELSFTALVARHSPSLAPQVILAALLQNEAVTEVGVNFWKPLKQEYVEASLPDHFGRLASLVVSMLATLENNTRKARDGTELFERTVIIESPLTSAQLLELQSYLKVVGGQFLQRVDTFAAVDLQEKKTSVPSSEIADMRTGLQCFLYVEPPVDKTRLRDAIKFD
jgi:hypothetical protein